MKGILHEDEEWTPRLYWLAETYYYADAPFYCYRKRAGSITSMVKYSNVKSICLVADSLERFMGRHPDSRVYVRMRQRSVARAINVQTQFLTNAEIGDLLKEFDNTPVIDMIRRSFYFTFLSSVLSTKNHLVFEKYLRKVRNTVKRWLPRRLELKLRSLRAFVRRYLS
ncbi:MAG: hypothetical protein LBE65_03255 [Synergistaceae bacterium]|jgi:hypothetical protein|nr:hypothetical protein [Synergistaceae bacterium]